MKGLKKVVLATAVAAAPFAAQAELKALDDTSMSSVTGQAGVTIDLEATVSIGEVAYQDGGYLAFTGVDITGSDGVSALDNVRMFIDVVGASGTDLGSPARGAAYLGGLGIDASTVNEALPALDDGDLVISLRAQDPTAGVDYGLGIDTISLAESTGTRGNLYEAGVTTSTVLVSDLQIGGNLGPIDIVIKEDTKNMNINAYFNAFGSLDMPFVGTSMNFALHNNRGDSTATGGSQQTSFAHAQVDVSVTPGYAATSDDTLHVVVQDFSGDLDLTNINTGGTASIGSLYMTDLAITADMHIYGH
ncbi:DUF6160 family protein [Marinobacter sp. F4216]|uniref:DUF6160 family protein n=1 Tax=Marinobacter sp. F4216 TaxID=2874281 RepID=UPI001CBB1DA0|nr:DUF6160 family protein [Marinobacter sp. F4216]MBZ2167917.1 DUF6160 family protein [Marinobacter sp. F4216]